MSRTSASLRPDDRAILDALADGPLSTREVSDRIVARVRDEWAEAHGYEIEWGTEREPFGARLLASSEAREAGLKLLTFEIAPRLASLEKRGAVERIQIEGQRPMMWNRRA
jgi:hypothetical protein